MKHCFSSGHCEERSDEAIQPGLLRFARNDTAGIVIQSKPIML
jgi:hypothetical protein